jgi:glycerol-1-phosphate dehydrogenase [NAD(P)+]
MLPTPGRPFSFHGEQIGVTTLTMARLQDRMLDGPAPKVIPDSATESEFVARFGPALGASCWKDYAQKRLTQERADMVNQRIAARWDDIRAAIAAIALRADALARVLEAAKAPRAPEDLGWPRAAYREAVHHAREIRNRYTFLDLAADAGVLERWMPEIVG